MSQEEKKNEGLSRREFLKDAGLLVGGAAVGSMALFAACEGGKETTITKTATKYVCPIDGQEFTSFDALKAHFASAHPASAVTVTDMTLLDVNGTQYWLKLESDWSLSFVLRNKLGLFGLKEGCNMGECGTCTILVDGVNVYSCLLLAIEASGKKILTVEGISDGINLHPLQKSFMNNAGFQCGYCTSGMILASKALLDKKPNPSRDEVRQALAGHLCNCGNYKKIVDSVVKVGA